jgi:hypothetical protein
MSKPSPLFLSLAGCVLLAGLMLACGMQANAPAPTVVSGTGADVTAKVEEFKQLLGGANNGGEPGDFKTGYREITWDALPDELSAPNDYAPDFFNDTVAPRARGMLLSTPGTGLMVSADSDNPTGTLPRFGHINASYADSFKVFSAERLFSPIGSIFVDVTFFVPGTKTPAVVQGFGGVYADVDTLYTAYEFFDVNGASLGKYEVPIADHDLSFIGVVFSKPTISRVRVQLGTVALGPDDSAKNDVSVMDNFIYAEPQPLP